ncbi:putative disease resistance RPP13-like protein 1 isoform X1 [Camellia sinensis]|nr:putative disease resistance RPP13-like protein 1 isoform X1 [Camellia sinensis]XP_028095779.1 putative disease resistance RPP13-like protein 1 isoform X1 [Camellia sinensis]XP_028095780.1 putative disease resistance RPP13-like protein 1 isoform X1 [Camellia sinensis]
MPIAEIFLSAFVKLLFEKMSSFASSKLPTFEGIDTQLTNWTNMLSQIEALLVDAEEKQLTDRAVNLWLDNLQDLAYDLDDVVDEFATEALRQSLKAKPPQASSSKVWNLIPNFKPRDVMFNFKMKSQIQEINTRLHNSFEQCSKLNLVKIVGTTPTPPTKTWQRPDSTSLFDEPRIYGREHDQRKIIELLVRGDESSHNNIGVIPIVGMGGIGKTTLAQMVYNNETVQKHFHLKAWVCVSDEFDIMRITKAILESVTSQTFSFNNLDQVQVQLKQALAGKKFLIVLDDVWNKKYSDWNVLKKPFNEGAQGSKVVVTTRNRDVARMMRAVELHYIEVLSDDDCWSLFSRHAFENRSIDANPNLVSIGKKIVKKCKGLPLAARTLGGLLHCKEQDEEWEDVLHSKIWDLPQESDILPALRLSYHHLPSHLKQCFAYCSIIPNDYEFEEEELVLLWMAEGFIQKQRKKQMEDVGGEYFQELLSRSFFQPSSTGKSSKFVMHDLINDLAQVVARDTCLRLDDKFNDQEQYQNLKKVRHSSYMQKYYEGMKKFEIFDKAMHLRTFLPFYTRNGLNCYLASNVPLNLLPKLRRLRVLNMSRYDITEVPNSVGDLKHLRYLNLSHTSIEELPESLGSLYNLQTLMLRECRKLKKLPTYLGNLIDLRHLDTTNAHSLREMPLGIGKLASLQTLSNFIVTKNNGQQLTELGNLIYLRGKLCLSGLQNVVVPLDAREANLNDKKGLDVLLMEWSVNSDDLRDGRFETEVLDMLQPPKDLKELCIKGYLGTGLPNWIGEFSNMADLSLDNCGNCASLPPLGQLPSLKKLYIKGMSVLKQVGCEFYGQGGVQPFPLLETLSFKNMPEWEDWYTFGDHKEVQPFTRVKSLSLKKCPKLLKMLPTDLPCLNNLEIRDCPKLCGMMPKDLPCLNNLNISVCSQFLVEGSSISLPSLTSIAMNDVPLTSLQAVLEMRSMVDDELISANAKSKHPSSITSLSIGMIKKLELLPKWVTHGLMELEALEITCCEELKTLWKNEERVQHSLSLPAFRRLEIEGCPQLVSLFEEDEDDDNKGQHEQQQQQQEGLPCIVRRLERLTIYNCEKLEKLPRLLHSFTFLGELCVYKCPSLSSFPETGFPCTLKTLRIGDCEALQSLFGCLTQINDSNLQVLDVQDCPSLTCLISCRGGRLPPTLKELQIRRCKKLEALLVVEEGMEITCPPLEHIWITDCDRLKYLPDALRNNNNNNNLRNLSGLYLNGCKNLEYIPEGWFHSATNLAYLDIRGCKKLKALPHGLQSITYLTSLQLLSMDIPHWNNNFKKIGLHSLSSLRTLLIEGPISVAEDEEEEEEEEEGVAGSSFPIDGKLLPTSLINLWIRDLRNLEKLSSKLFQNLASLESLEIWGCPRLKSLPVQRLPPSLVRLTIWGSRNLTRKCEKGKGKYWPHLAHIPEVDVHD